MSAVFSISEHAYLIQEVIKEVIQEVIQESEKCVQVLQLSFSSIFRSKHIAAHSKPSLPI